VPCNASNHMESCEGSIPAWRLADGCSCWPCGYALLHTLPRQLRAVLTPRVVLPADEHGRRGSGSCRLDKTLGCSHMPIGSSSPAVSTIDDHVPVMQAVQQGAHDTTLDCSHLPDGNQKQGNAHAIRQLITAQVLVTHDLCPGVHTVSALPLPHLLTMP
jgi:hypothetical protein